MTCPETGLQIPKTVKGNLEWRRKMRSKANSDPAFRAVMRAACKSSIYFWINAFGWTFLQKKVGSDGVERKVIGNSTNVPFITWKIQDETIAQLLECIGNPHDEMSGGKNALINKSRDMGASWLVLTVFHWYWQFLPGCTFLEMSRNMKYVDQRGNMDSLFEKHRYLHKMQPTWLRPGVEDNVAKLVNVDNGNVIIGESTNEHAGQGARKTAVLLDEFARVREAEEIDLALDDTTSCKLYNSTPQGPETWFSKLYKGRACISIDMPWFRHPDKGFGATLTDAHGAEIGYPCLPGKKWTSPWYHRLVHGDPKTGIGARSRRSIAQNVDMNHGQSGRMFFAADEIEQHRYRFEAPPLAIGTLEYLQGGMRDDQRFMLLRRRDADALTFSHTGRNAVEEEWKLWCKLIGGRPDQTHAYTLGVDISAGTGGSNSIITVYDATARRVIAKMWSATTNPYILAEEAVKMGIWCGGRTGCAVLNWETNGGVGAQFTQQIKKIGYNPQYQRRNFAKRGHPKMNKRGWHSDPVLKEALLAEYRDGLKGMEIINPCRESLDECLSYIYDDNWKLTPGSGGVDESSGASATHGDHAIADALAFLAREDVGKGHPATITAPRNSYEGIRQEDDRVRQRREDVWT